MKFKLTTLFLMLTMLCCYWLFAHQNIREIFFDDSPTEHSIEERSSALEQSTFATLQNGEILNEDFELSTGWIFINSGPNEWHIGDAIHHGGLQSLYISNDNGVSNDYSSSMFMEEFSTALSPAMSIPSNATDYVVSFDWRCLGDGNSWWVSDAFSVWLVPASFTPAKNTKVNPSASGGILLGEEFYGQSTFKKENIKVNLSAYSGTQMKVLFQWVNDDYNQQPPPAAIDNLVVYALSCIEPNGLAVSGIKLDEATVTWNAPSASVTDFELYLGTDGSYPSSTSSAVSIVNSKTHTFTNLNASTYYYVWYRSVCGTTDKSYWEGPVKFMTDCSTLQAPFSETFDTDSPYVECWSFVEATGSDDDEFEITTGYKMDGDRGLMFRSYTGGSEHSSYAISPGIILNGGIYKLTYYYKTSPSGDNEFEVLLSNSDTALSSFTTTLVGRKKYQKSNYVKETVFINGITGPSYIAWHVSTIGSTTFHLDNVSIEPVICTEPLNIRSSNITMNSATVQWDDAIATEWEYAAVGFGSGEPSSAGTKTTQQTATISLDFAGNTLTDDTYYDVYVRSKCTDGSFGEWQGPIAFKTACTARNVPYSEGFDFDSNDLSCWTILDVNNDGTQYGNIWKQSEYTVYKGDRCMYYSGSSPQNEDWLISPGFNLTGGLYAITFYYQLNQNTKANLEVKVSTNGVDPASFTQTIGTTLPYKGAVYAKKVVYVEGITGVANIGFHVTGVSGSIQIDEFSIASAVCRAPDDFEITNITSNSVDINWVDDTNTKWEYYVQPMFSNALPVGSGSNSTTNSATATRLTGSNAQLLPNTEYEIYVRSTCGTGKYSEWVGPLVFRTQCEIMLLPYQEGFNSDSSTQYCWKIVDGNDDKPWYGGFGEWFTTTEKAYEGDQSMYFTNMDSTNNDWLMSPFFTLDSKKVYRISYMYRTQPESKAEFEVRLSTSEREMADYTTVLLPKKAYDNVPWKQQKLMISGIDGPISIAFYVSDFSSWGSNTYIDDFRIEEVTSCPEPLTQGAENITGTSADIFWDNDYGNTNWEYFVRKKAFLVAPPLSDGTPTTTNKVNVTKDNFGADIEGNTWYEFYVRSLCNDGSKTVWTGPYYFRTECTYSTLPFWEGFNGSDNSLRCWTILDENADKKMWKQMTTSPYEGSHVMNFTQSGTGVANDWFISPLFKNVDPTKTYRIKFNYKGSGTSDMELLASTAGNSTTSFTTVIAANQSYTSSVYQEAVYFFTGISGDFYLAFHALGTGSQNITIDNLYIDEVTTCGQPTNLSVKSTTPDSANLVWKDAFNNTAWQYMVQKLKQIPPTNKDAGVAVQSNDIVVTKDIDGDNLQPNTDYVYYVRTDCGNGQFSEWSGPVAFTTECGVYNIPYEAGFNSTKKELRCWEIVKGANAGSANWAASNVWAYEGDRLMQFRQTSSTDQADSYLISPTINFTPGNYVLKYYYKTNLENLNEFEVLLSNSGTNIANFTQTLVAKKGYNNAIYVQETVYITGVTGNVNIAWHATTKGKMELGIDKVTIEKAGTCPEPTNVRVTDFTSNTIDVEWDQQGGITQWEVYVTGYGSGVPPGAVGTVVTGTPKYTATGLTSGKAYHIYVRAKCTGGSEMSNWSTPANGPTEVTTSGGCAGALTVPVNTGNSCIQSLGVSTVNSPEVDPNTFTDCMSYMHTNELWFEFTATSSSHSVSFYDIIGLNKMESPSISMEVYSGNCANIYTTKVDCYTFESSYGSPLLDDRSRTVNGLIPGNKYYIRVTIPIEDFLFTICITSSEYNYVAVSKNGDKYTTEELVKEVLIQSDCDLVSNIKYQGGATLGGNTLGYFNKNGSTFPFEEGIVLATHDISTVPGPYYNYGDAGGFMGVRGKLPEWEGDEDLNAVIANAGGSAYAGNKSVSILEFDFIPVKDTIKFEYLMASESYLHNCTVVCWGAGSLFAAWLTEVETGQGQNLALVPGTKDPITLSTVRDTEKSGAGCESVHPEFFGSYFGNGQEDPLLAPINYIGMTKPMSSEPIYVKPGTKYRIKLAMADFCNTNHVSAVFFNAKSFDLGTLDLGADLTVEANTAVCSNEAKVIKSGLLTDNVEISWTKDDVVIPGANQPDLAVSESGEYKVIAHYPTIDCDVVGAVKVEMFTPLREILAQPNTIEYCRYVLGGIFVDLAQVEATMLKGLDESRYNFYYYETVDDASNAQGAITETSSHEIAFSEAIQYRYVLVEDTVTGCSDIFEIPLISIEGEDLAQPESVKVCATYEFPPLLANQYYYEGPAATGTKYQVGDQLLKSGIYTIYILQDNGGGCYKEVSYTVEITEAVVADILEDKVYTCDVHTLVELTNGNGYFTASNGKGTELKAGELILDNQKIYIYKESEDGLCYDESSFTISYEECPIPKGISPNGDGMNDTFDLTSNGVSNVQIYNRLGNMVYEFSGHYTNQWYGQNKQGKPLTSGTYYYVLATRAGVVTGWVQLNY